MMYIALFTECVFAVLHKIADLIVSVTYLAASTFLIALQDFTLSTLTIA